MSFNILLLGRGKKESLTRHVKNCEKKDKIKYHQLILGKPIGDFWIDDKAIKFDNRKNINKKLKK